jgi:hypothetical protein
MIRRYVFDTVSFINYYSDFFQEEDRLSPRIRREIDRCLSEDYVNHKIIIPSVVFVEIFQKQLNTSDREIAPRFKYEVFIPLADNDDVEIKGIEKEVLKVYSRIDNSVVKLETHDKIILASAAQVDGILISNDSKIKEYVESTNLVELVF